MLRLLTSILLGCSVALGAQSDRIADPISGTRGTTIIPGHVRTLANSYVDQGPLDPSRQIDGLLLFLKPSASQQSELDQLLIDLQDPASPRHHDWLTPGQYAERFGVSASDTAKITTWLESQGFRIGWVGQARNVIVFSGAAGAVESAFHPGIHSFRSPKATHYTNTRNPSVPSELAGVVRSIGGLDDFIPESDQHPAYTSANGTHSLGPNDLATIYDFATWIAAGIDGTGQKIVVTGESAVLTSDFQAYRARYNMPSPNVQTTLVPGFANPGTTTSLLEADIDVELASAVARNAAILYVYSGSFYNAVVYAVDQNLAPVITASFHTGCDASVPAATLTAYQATAQQANAEGISWIQSSGDIGAAGCDNNGEAMASMGLATRFPADVPEITGVGGTQLSQTASYWSATNDSFGGSALSYIPETVWNTTAATIGASTGGASTFFVKPPWQAGPGVPNDGARDTPDVAVAAAGIPYLVNTNGTVVNQGATSSAAPVFAGMMVLLNQYLVAKGAQTQPGLGGLNPMLYRIAQSNPSAFHDITTGNNIVPCVAGSPDCVNGQMGYTAGPGFDLCTGLGSVDLANLGAAAISKPTAVSRIVVSSDANPVHQQVNSRGVSSWNVDLTLTEEGGVSTTLTGFTVDGKSYPLSQWFVSSAIGAFGTTTTSVSFTDTSIPMTHIYGFTGSDANGRTWTASISLQYVGIAPVSNSPVPTITGSTNGASFQQSYAPGMILSVFGTNLATAAEPASGVPLPTYANNFEATVNGVIAPLYYVSGAQANIQIPYGTAPGTATLTVYNGGQSASTQIQIAAAAPGIFTDGNNNTVPYASGSPGQALVLFITGDGEVSPTLASGSAPASSTPLANLPKSNLPVSMTIGGQPAQILFDGIPYGLVGVTQINFVVPAGLSPGPQPVVITVGAVMSKPATFTVTN